MCTVSNCIWAQRILIEDLISVCYAIDVLFLVMEFQTQTIKLLLLISIEILFI